MHGPALAQLSPGGRGTRARVGAPVAPLPALALVGPAGKPGAPGRFLRPTVTGLLARRHSSGKQAPQHPGAWPVPSALGGAALRPPSRPRLGSPTRRPGQSESPAEKRRSGPARRPLQQTSPARAVSRREDFPFVVLSMDGWDWAGNEPVPGVAWASV